MAYPILAAGSTWYKGTTARSAITQINIVDSYTATGSETESWAADTGATGSITCYVTGTVLTIAGNGSGKIAMNSNSSYAFGGSSESTSFVNTTAITGADLLDTSNVTDASYMFRHARKLTTLDVSNWDVSKVTTMYAMFSTNPSFGTATMALETLDVSNWNTENVTTMRAMFQYCTSLKTLDVHNWNVSKVTTIRNMFAYTSNLKTLDISNWNGISLSDTICVFQYSGLEYINASGAVFGTSKSLFQYAANVKKINISNADISNSTDTCSQMFDGCTELEEIIGLDTLDTSNIGYTYKMFNGCSSLKALDLSNFITTQIPYTNAVSGTQGLAMAYMFSGMTSLEKITIGDNFSFDGDGTLTTPAILPTPSTDYFTSATGNWYSLPDYVAYAPADVPNKTAATYIAVPSLPILAPGSSWYTQGGTSVTRNTITEIELKTSHTPSEELIGSWDASAAIDGSVMVYIEGTKMIIAGNGYSSILANEDSNYAFSDPAESDVFSSASSFEGLTILDTSNVTDMSYMFRGMIGVSTLDVSKFDVSNVTTMEGLFAGKSTIGTMSLTTLDVSKWDTSSCTNMTGMFSKCVNLTSLDIANWNTSNVASFTAMFGGSNYVGDMKFETLDVSRWDTSSAINMAQMFYGCAKLKSIPIDNWDVSNVEDMNHMFCDCFALETINMTMWDTSSLTTPHAMFNDCHSLTTIDVSNWNTSKFWTFAQLFERCSGLTEIVGLENFDTSGLSVDRNNSAFFEMFSGCTNLKQINVSSFVTSNALSMANMFYGCANVTELDLSNFDTRNCENLSEMFTGMNRLAKIKIGENFSFVGDGTTSCVLPTSSAEYIVAADGNWYSIDRNSEAEPYVYTAYTPANVPNNVARTYYASKYVAAADDDEMVLVKNGTLVRTAIAIREKSGKSETIYPGQFSGEILALT